MASVSIFDDSSFHTLYTSEFDATFRVSTHKAVPSKFNFTNDPAAHAADSLPVIDFAALIAGDPDRRNEAVQDLATACREWGFFILVNHGIPETLMDATFTAAEEFWNLPDSEKKVYEARSGSDPITCGNLSLTDSSNKTFTLWRDYIKFHVHPDFHCPQRPQVLREVVLEYTQRSRELLSKLTEAVSAALELDQHYVHEMLMLDSSFQIFAANYYPPCPQPDQAIGIPPHTDPGFFNFVINNGVAGLQIEHDGKWFNADSPKNSILVNVGDQLQILSNGKYKSVKHKAVINMERERISVVVSNGPALEAVVRPAAPLVEKDGRAMYCSIKYKEYLESIITKTRVGGKSLLEQNLIN